MRLYLAISFFLSSFLVLGFGWKIQAEELNESDLKMGVIYLQPLATATPTGSATATFTFSPTAMGPGKPTATPTSTPEFLAAVDAVTGTGGGPLEEKKQLDPVVKSYFGDLYDDKLADWVVFIDQDGYVHQYMRKKDLAPSKANGVKISREQNVWALVLVDFAKYPDPDGNTTNHSLVFNLSLDSIKKYTSITQSFLNGLALAKTGLSGTASSNGDQAGAVTLSPVYDLDDLANGVEALADAASSEEMKKGQGGVGKSLGQAHPSKQLLEGLAADLKDLSQSLQKEKDSKSLGKDLQNLEEADGDIKNALARLKDPKNDMAKMDAYLASLLVSVNKLSGSNMGVTASLEKIKDKIDAAHKEIAQKNRKKHLYLFMGMKKVPLDQNSIDRFTLRIPPEYATYFNKVHPAVVTNTFGNSEGAGWGLSLGLGSTHTGCSLDLCRDLAPDFYLLGHWFVVAPEKPWNFQSASLFLGTQVSLSTPFNQIAVGADWGDPFGEPLFRDAGFFLGLDFVRNTTTNLFEPRGFYGFNYFL